MAAPAAFVLENEFQDALEVALYMPAVECLQLCGNWIFYNWWPNAGTSQVVAAWIIELVLCMVAIFCALVAAIVLNGTRVSERTVRRLVFVGIFTLPVIQLQAAIQSVFEKALPLPGTCDLDTQVFWNQVAASFIASIILFGLANLACKCVCRPCIECFQTMDQLFINPEGKYVKVTRESSSPEEYEHWLRTELARVQSTHKKSPAVTHPAASYPLVLA